MSEKIKQTKRAKLDVIGSLQRQTEAGRRRWVYVESVGWMSRAELTAMIWVGRFGHPRLALVDSIGVSTTISGAWRRGTVHDALFQLLRAIEKASTPDDLN